MIFAFKWLRIWTADKDVNESDPRSNVHYLGSSENKAWKKFWPVRDLNPWPLQYLYLRTDGCYANNVAHSSLSTLRF